MEVELVNQIKLLNTRELGKPMELRKKSLMKRFLINIKTNYDLYLLTLPTLVYFIVFHYLPMYGIQIAFKDFVATQGIWGSPFIGFEHFTRFFKSYNFWILMKNTLGISIYQLVVGFPTPIILALLLNEVTNKHFKKTVQMITYAPHFISTVVVVGMLGVFFSTDSGIFNSMLKNAGMGPLTLLSDPKWFKSVFVFSGVWQSIGWGSIIYMAALAGIDPQLHEAATMDGATKLQRIWHVNIPGILPTAVTLLILSVGNSMNVGFEKVFLMQNALNMGTSDVISTYVYRVGIQGSEFSFASAVGLFNSVINCVLLISVNKISRKISNNSLW